MELEQLESRLLLAVHLAADLNNDGVVDVGDLAVLGANYGKTTSTGDITHDGVVDVGDLGLLGHMYGMKLNPAAAQIDHFFQPWSFNMENPNAPIDSTLPDYVSTELKGEDLRDPTDVNGGTAVYHFDDPQFTLFGTDGPKYSDVMQGQLADCTLLADAAAIAYARPQDLKNDIIALGDGTYAVKFYRAIYQYSGWDWVRVDGDLPNIGLPYEGYAAVRSNKMWVAILEKAYAEWQARPWWVYDPNDPNGLVIGTYKNLSYGDRRGVAFNAIVGPSADLVPSIQTLNVRVGISIDPNVDATRIFGYLQTLTQTHAAITLGTQYATTIPNNHAYTFLSAYVKVDGTRMVDVYNPWGYTISMNINDFVKQFHAIASASSWWDGSVTAITATTILLEL